MIDTARLTAALADRYRVERELGEGGMATVYLAYDVRHDRHVALKVLRPELAAVIGADRFLKEIKVTAHLQHPHILGLIDSGEADGLLYYVMPFVEGQSLRDRLTHEKQLPIDDAVRIAHEVASALDYAHRHGVIHRDIKPENILLHEEQALVADFGIALAVSAAGATRMTETGMSLGTPHYMSPEQAMGERELTARSDVYALGAVLYEMLVGEPPFTGPTAQAIVAKVVTEVPRSLIAQRHTVPPHVEAAILLALEKLPADRFASTAAFADALAEPSLMAAHGARTTVRESQVWDVVQWRRLTLAFAVLAVGFGGLAIWGWLHGRGPALVSRFPLVLEGEYANVLHEVALSPDGARIIYSADSLGGLFVRDHDRLESSPVPDGELGDTPFFSPDGQEVAFYNGTPGALRAQSLTGGAGRVLVRDSAFAAGGAWSNDGWIYFIGGVAHALLRVRAGGGKPELVARPDTAHDELFFNSPQILPGDRTALVTIWRRRGATDIATVDIATGKASVLTRGVEAQYARSGHLIVLGADGSVQAVRFDVGHLTLIGRPVTVLDGVAVGTSLSGSGVSPFAFSNTGTLIYQTALPMQQLMRVAHDGRAQPVDTGWSGDFGESDLSPDGTQLAITVVREGRPEIWVKALRAGTLTRLQYEGTLNYRPSWTPDGLSLLFISDRSGNDGAYRVPADGSAPAILLRGDPRGLEEASLSRDGRWLIYRTGTAGDRDLYAIRPGIDSMPTPIATSRFEEYSPTQSPDGRWVAYVSEESGQQEVFVRPFPNAQAARWQVSRAGGSEPVWAHNGRELFYRNAAFDLVAAEVATTPSFRVVGEHVLFSTRDYLPIRNSLNQSMAYNRGYTASPDDRSFLFVRPRPGAQSQLIMVTNWFEELKAKVGK
jgi:eukaryotic-like serine/threonine-protein kinase